MAIIKTFPRLQISGWKANPHLIPQISDPMDDEFDNPAGTLNANWTVITDTSLGYDVNRTMPHHLWVKLDGGASSVLDIQKTISESDVFSYTAHLMIPSGITGTNSYIIIANSDNKYRILTGIQHQSTTQRLYFNTYNNDVAGTALYFDSTRWHDEIYLQIQNDGSDNWQAGFSYDGLGWTLFASRNQAVTIDHLRFYFYNSATTYSGDLWMASDFVRRNWRTQ